MIQLLIVMIKTPSQKNSLHEILNQPFQKQEIDMILKKLKKGMENNSTFSDIILYSP